MALALERPTFGFQLDLTGLKNRVFSQKVVITPAQVEKPKPLNQIIEASASPLAQQLARDIISEKRSYLRGDGVIETEVVSFRGKEQAAREQALTCLTQKHAKTLEAMANLKTIVDYNQTARAKGQLRGKKRAEAGHLDNIYRTYVHNVRQELRNYRDNKSSQLSLEARIAKTITSKTNHLLPYWKEALRIDTDQIDSFAESVRIRAFRVRMQQQDGADLLAKVEDQQAKKRQAEKIKDTICAGLLAFGIIGAVKEYSQKNSKPLPQSQPVAVQVVRDAYLPVAVISEPKTTYLKDEKDESVFLPSGIIFNPSKNWQETLPPKVQEQRYHNPQELWKIDLKHFQQWVVIDGEIVSWGEARGYINNTKDQSAEFNADKDGVLFFPVANGKRGWATMTHAGIGIMNRFEQTLEGNNKILFPPNAATVNQYTKHLSHAMQKGTTRAYVVRQEILGSGQRGKTMAMELAGLERVHVTTLQKIIDGQLLLDDVTSFPHYYEGVESFCGWDLEAGSLLPELTKLMGSEDLKGVIVPFLNEYLAIAVNEKAIRQFAQEKFGRDPAKLKAFSDFDESVKKRWTYRFIAPAKEKPQEIESVNVMLRN